MKNVEMTITARLSERVENDFFLVVDNFEFILDDNRTVTVGFAVNSTDEIEPVGVISAAVCKCSTIIELTISNQSVSNDKDTILKTLIPHIAKIQNAQISTCEPNVSVIQIESITFTYDNTVIEIDSEIIKKYNRITQLEKELTECYRIMNEGRCDTLYRARYGQAIDQMEAELKELRS